MVRTGKQNSISEQDISETSTLSGTQDAYEPLPVPTSMIRGAPTNYLRVLNSNGGVPEKWSAAIWGQYFIDLSIPPVPRTVSHVVSGPENLFLHTRSGFISVEVWVTGSNKLRRASMKLRCDNGNVCAQVHDAFSGSGREQRPSLDIGLYAGGGDVSLSLPRFFRGLMTINSSQGRIAFSPAFEERTALLSDEGGIRVYLVGDRPRFWMLWSNDDDKKEGYEGPACSDIHPEEPLDKLSMGSWNLVVRIRWDGEPELS